MKKEEKGKKKKKGVKKEVSGVTKKDKKICLEKGQLKTILDEDRFGDICDSARELISEIDEEFEEEKPQKRRKTIKKQFDKFVKEWL